MDSLAIIKNSIYFDGYIPSKLLIRIRSTPPFLAAYHFSETFLIFGRES